MSAGIDWNSELCMKSVRSYIEFELWNWALVNFVDDHKEPLRELEVVLKNWQTNFYEWMNERTESSQIWLQIQCS